MRDGVEQWVRRVDCGMRDRSENGREGERQGTERLRTAW